MSDTQHFETWNAFLAAVSMPPARDVDRPSSVYSTREFTGTDTYDEALDLATRGWADGLAKVEGEFRKLRASLPKGEDIVGRFAEAGDEPDVGLFVEGDPECMVEFIMQERARPVVKLVVSVSFSACVGTDVIFRRGAAVMAVIDAMEDAGVRMEVEAIRSFRSGARTYHDSVTVKHAEDAMDRDRLVFALCHPSMTRRLCFRLSEVESDLEWSRRGGYGYGMPVQPVVEEGACVIPMMHGNEPQWRNTESAVAECERLIEEMSR